MQRSKAGSAFHSLYQSFVDGVTSAQGPERVARLRAQLAQAGLDGFVVPRADAWQNEYVPAGDERLAWLTGFTGSAGACVVLADRAAIFADGRYTLQVREQTDARTFELCDLAADPPAAWLARNAGAGARVGFDPWLLTPAQTEALRKGLEKAGAELTPAASNPVDAIWDDRPPEPAAPVELYPERLAGESAAARIERIRAAIEGDALLLSDAHAVAWTFNIRGADVAHTPLPLARALIRKAGRPTLYVGADKLSAPVREVLERLAEIAPPQAVLSDLEKLGAAGAQAGFDAASAPEKLVAAFRAAGGRARLGADPVALMKAVKNKAELKGARAAQLRDGAALSEFLHWLDRNALKTNEIEAAEALETFRRATGRLAEISFPTISAFGAHAASPHYRVTQASNVPLGRGIYLVDSGGQYRDGTTDVTRAIAIGRPGAEARARNTLVLKGHIAIATAVFPRGTSGAQIDAFARRPLWEAGLDFDHGTGHGIGAYLSVHEGPQRISKLGTVALEPGMILSNEPGYYKAGDYGIRIENLVIVVERKIAGAERPMLGFETITLAPIDLALVQPKLLTRDELRWLNAYHARVRAELSDKVSKEARAWLKQATRKLA